MSAANQLVLWHGRTAPHILQEPARTKSVILLAACLYDRAAAAGLDGAAVAEVQLEQAANVLERYLVSALQACTMFPAAEGSDVVDELLADCGTDGFEWVRQGVRRTLAHHRADGGPHVRIADRRSALRETGAHPYLDY
ncbi:hypothetical protein [Streptomyces sp. NPDC048295]|uniref:hypothetical protein n=1 Tax=Streptomyces sp. NPDC048295 TaxID=3154617 RepID=UPI00343A66CF